jgi:hypothetical protein
MLGLERMKAMLRRIAAPKHLFAAAFGMRAGPRVRFVDGQTPWIVFLKTLDLYEGCGRADFLFSW